MIIRPGRWWESVRRPLGHLRDPAPACPIAPTKPASAASCHVSAIEVGRGWASGALPHAQPHTSQQPRTRNLQKGRHHLWADRRPCRIVRTPGGMGMPNFGGRPLRDSAPLSTLTVARRSTGVGSRRVSNTPSGSLRSSISYARGAHCAVGGVRFPSCELNVTALTGRA